MSETCNKCGADPDLLLRTHGCTDRTCPSGGRVTAFDLLGIAPDYPATDRQEAKAAEQLRAELTETRTNLDRARDTAALLESELAGAIRPQVLTEDTPEPPRPWTLVYADRATVGPSSLNGDTWPLALALVLPDGRPVYVIAGQAAGG